MFASFQKINNKLKLVYNKDFDLSTPSQVKTSSGYLKEIDQEIKNAKSKINNIANAVNKLKALRLSSKSMEKLNSLESVYKKYLESLENLEKTKNGFELFVEFRGYEAEVLQRLNRFNTIVDSSDYYISVENYKEALNQHNEAVKLNDEMYEFRKNEYDNNKKFNMELIKKLWAAEIKYKQLLEEKGKELNALIANPNIPDAEKFKNSDKLSDEYNQLYVEDNEYNDLVSAWLQDNVYKYWDKSDDILTETDIKYNSLMKDFIIS